MTADEQTQACLACCWPICALDTRDLPNACCPIKAANKHDLSFQEIRPLMRLCKALGWSPDGFVWAAEQKAERRRVVGERRVEGV